MQISTNDVRTTINYLVEQCQRTLNEQYKLDDAHHNDLRMYYKNSLYGLRLSFIENRIIVDLIVHAEETITCLKPRIPFESSRQSVQTSDTLTQVALFSDFCTAD